MQDLTSGSLVRHLLKTTGFILVTMVFQTLYFLVDLYWVGRLGKEAVAGVAVAGNLTFVVLAITQMLGVGTTTLIAHATGRKEHERAVLLFNQSLALSAVVGAVFLAVAMMLRTAYAVSLGADAATAASAEDYLRWFIPAMALQFGIVSMAAALRGTGNFKPGMIVGTASVVLNMLMAPFLIFGWGTGRAYGVAGAAMASLISVAIGVVWLALYFRPRESYLRFVPGLWKPRLDLWKRMLGIGLPAGAEFALMAVYLVIVYTITRPFGAAAQAGFGIGMRIIQAVFLPVVALGFAVAPVAGQNYGAGLGARVRQTFTAAVSIAAGMMLIFTILCQIQPAGMIRVFSRDTQVVSVGTDYLRIVSWNFIASGVVFVASSMFQAIGNTFPSLAASLVRLVLVAVPAYVLSRMPGFELRAIWYLSVGAVAVQMVLSLLLLQRELRLRLPAPAAPLEAAAS